MNTATDWQRWARWALDIGLAAISVNLALVLALEFSPPQSRLRIAAVVIAVVHGASVLFRRGAPRAVAGVLLATGLVYALLGYPPSFLGPAGLIGLYTVAARTAPRESVRWLGGTVLLAVGGGLLHGQDWDALGLAVVLAAGSWLLADQVRRRQEEATRHAERAHQLEVAREELAEYAVAQERLRIARELHDVLAHSLSVVVLNAGAGRVIAEQDPAAAVAALQTIETVTRDAMSEMRQLTAVLRDEHRGVDLAPLPGLRDLPALVARVAEAGVAVEVRIDGQPRELPEGLDLALYRIIQEALTNTMKHSTARSAGVQVIYATGDVSLTVTDPGPTRAQPAAGGSGLVGMRERIEIYGGDLEVGPMDGGGYRVHAVLPTERAHA